MSKSLKTLLKKNREVKQYTSNGNPIEDFRDEYLPKSLPKDKKKNNKSDIHDETYIIVPDIHSYLRDKKAFELFMKSLPILEKKYNVTKFVQLGDALECGEGSSHPQNSVFERTPSYIDEINWIMDDFWKPSINRFSNCNFYALMGNHENRWNKKIARDIGKVGLPQDYAMHIFNELMPIDLYNELGIHVVPYGNESVKEGILELIPNKLIAIHGWSIAKHAAFSHLSMTYGGYSVIHGHTHRSQHFTTRNPITGQNIEAWSFGSLAKVEMKWHGGAPNQHVLGFGIVNVHDDDFSVHNVSINIKPDGSRKAILPDGTVLIEK
jgi:predicted phosphodiesterase